jgi:hypothetical protein
MSPVGGGQAMDQRIQERSNIFVQGGMLMKYRVRADMG